MKDICEVSRPEWFGDTADCLTGMPRTSVGSVRSTYHSVATCGYV